MNNRTIKKENAQDFASLTTLVGGLAHEIRNPLSTININLQLLKEDWLDAGSPREKRALKKLDLIQAETQRLQETLDDFLRFIRIEDLELESHDINALIDEIVRFIGNEIRLKGIDIVRFYDYNLPRCMLDVKFMKQAFLNILMNARQAIEKDGQIMIRTSRSGEMLCVEITDTGIGMPHNVLERIFTPYYSTKESGTGLGMPTTKRIIEKHAGTIEVQSDRGHGTSVIVHLRPAGPEKQQDIEETGNTDD